MSPFRYRFYLLIVLCLSSFSGTVAAFYEDISPTTSVQSRYREAFHPSMIRTTNVTSNADASAAYPIIQSDGYIEYQFSGREFTTDPQLFETIRQDELFDKIPQHIQLGPPRLELSYLVQLQGQLDDDLFVSYYLFKEPDFPGQYSIEIQKGPNLLRFGQQNLAFKPVPFLQTEQSFEGVQFQSTQQNWNTTFAIGRSRSKPQKYESFANSQRSFQLGNSFILEGSEKVFINNRGVDPKDYILDYISGKLTFSKTLSPSDVVKVIYQFTNPVEDFIPSLSNQSVLGHQFEWAPRDSLPTRQFLTVSHQEQFTLAQTHAYWRRFFLELPAEHYGIQNVTLTHQGKVLQHNIDYSIKGQKIHFFHRSFEVNDLIRVSYDYIESEFLEESLEIHSPQGPYYLLYGNVVPKSLTVQYEGYQAQEFIDYVVDYQTGTVFFTYSVPADADIRVSYRYLKEVIKDESTATSPWSFRSSYLENRSKSNDDTLQTQQESIQASQVVVLGADEVAGTDLLPGTSRIQLLNGGLNLDKDIQYSVENFEADVVSHNAYKGQLFIQPGRTVPSGLIVTYQHFQLFSTHVTIFGTGSNRYDSVQIQNQSGNSLVLPIAFNGIFRIELRDRNGNIYQTLNAENIDREFSVNYDENGQFFSLEFLLGQQSSLDYYPKTSDTIKIFYYYDSSSHENAFDDAHQVLDLGVSYAPNDIWRLDAELAESRVNLRSNEVFTTRQFVSDGRLTSYSLGTDGVLIKQGSETVFVNGVSRRPFIHYTLDTISGLITFIEPIPVGTPITLSFKVINEVQSIRQRARAFSFRNELSSKTPGYWKVTNDVKTLAPDFVPIGELNETPGETVIENSLFWAKSPRLNATVDHRSSLLKDSASLTDRRLHSLESVLSIPISAVDSKHHVRIEKDSKESVAFVPESLNGLSTFNKDSLGAKSSLLLEYSPRFRLGSTHRQLNVYGTFSKQDLENHLAETSEIRFYKLQSDLVYTVSNPWIVQSLQFRPLAGVSVQNSSIYEVYTAEKNGVILGLGLNSTIAPGLREDAKIERNALQFTREDTQINDVIYNYHSHLDYVPSAWLQSAYKIDHEEDFGPVIGQEYLVNDRKDLSLKRLNPRPVLKQLKAPPFMTKPFDRSYVTAQHLTQFRRENNKLTFTDSVFKQASLYQVNLAPGLSLDSVRASTNDRNYTDQNQTSFQDFHRSNSQSRQWNAETTYTPPFAYLRALQHRYSLRSTRLDTDSLTLLSDRRTDIDTVINENDNYHEIRLSPQQFHVGPVVLANTTGMLIWHEEKQRDENNTISTSTTAFLDNFSLVKRELQVDTSLFRHLDSTLSYTRHDDYYNRNKAGSIVGSLFKRQHMIASDFSISPWILIDVNFGINTDYLFQYSDSDIHLSSDTLRSSADTVLFYRKKGGNLGLDYHLSQAVDLHAGTDLTFISQEQIGPDVDETFKDHRYDVGASWKPLRGLTIRYDLFFHQLAQNDDAFDGDSRLLTVIYNPIHYKNYNIDIRLSEETHNGFGFNDIENSLSQQLSGEVLRQQIRERDDKVFKASLLLSIDIPLDSYLYLETLKITGEGYFKIITDDFINTNNYDISGFYLKASILL